MCQRKVEIHRKLAKDCSSLVPAESTIVISQHYTSPTTARFCPLRRTVLSSTWRDSSHLYFSTSSYPSILDLARWRHVQDNTTEMRSNKTTCCSLDSRMIKPRWLHLRWMKVWGSCRIPGWPGDCPEDQTTHPSPRGLCGALLWQQLRTPLVWTPVMSRSRTVEDGALSSFWGWPD